MNYVKIGKFEKISNIDILNAENSSKRAKNITKKNYCIILLLIIDRGMLR